ncbi:MAG: SRPBCC domain-containing protein [Chitinophagaceae bacterium]
MTNKKKELVIVREFDAPKEVVFKAFSNAEALAEWWGPADFTTTVLKFDFKPKGVFHYRMNAPKPMWGRLAYEKIEEPDLLEFTSSFADANGEIIRAPIAPKWPLEIYNRFQFSEKNGRTILKMTAYPINPSQEDFDTFVSMEPNVQKGFKSSFDQLDIYINAQFKMRKELKTGTASRTSTYLNFPGNTEAAFNFYKSVFGGEFHGKGIQRLGDIPPQAEHPPVADNLKKLILHVELPILGGHILMGTDAPEEMGFKVNFGNNSHICLEPETKEETKKLFDALSAGGIVTMPLADMFLGTYFGYYGSCTDKFGVTWMFNYITQE